MIDPVTATIDTSQSTLRPDDSISQVPLHFADPNPIIISADSDFNPDTELTPSTQDPNAELLLAAPNACQRPVPKDFVIVTVSRESLSQAYEVLHKVKSLLSRYPVPN